MIHIIQFMILSFCFNKSYWVKSYNIDKILSCFFVCLFLSVKNLNVCLTFNFPANLLTFSKVVKSKLDSKFYMFIIHKAAVFWYDQCNSSRWNSYNTISYYLNLLSMYSYRCYFQSSKFLKFVKKLVS